VSQMVYKSPAIDGTASPRFASGAEGPAGAGAPSGQPFAASPRVWHIAKVNPGKAHIFDGGAGTLAAPHRRGQQLSARIVHVPYKGRAGP